MIATIIDSNFYNIKNSYQSLYNTTNTDNNYSIKLENQELYKVDLTNSTEFVVKLIN
jgi:hypothetical protein